jgi:predicted transcriptional regulator of viral defense system
MSVRELDDLLTTRRESWETPERPGNHEIIPLLIENDLLRIAEISSTVYGRKKRYVLGKVSFLQLASSFYKGSYLSHGTALQLHGLSSFDQVFVNREQSPKHSNSRLSQSGLDRAFKGPQRQSCYLFRYGSKTITFLNGKNTNRAGVIETRGSENEPLQVTCLERTLIDVIVRPQYAGGIRNVVRCFEKAKDRLSVAQVAELLGKTKYVYPYQQALGFVFQRIGVPVESLSPLKERSTRFKFYLDYAMKSPLFDRTWKIYYPSDL